MNGIGVAAVWMRQNLQAGNSCTKVLVDKIVKNCYLIDDELVMDVLLSGFG
jgi:hypothetical protein